MEGNQRKTINFEELLIVVVGYNRPQHINKTLSYLETCRGDHLSNTANVVVFLDGDKSSTANAMEADTLKLVKSRGYSCIKQTSNLGLRNNIFDVLDYIKNSDFDYFLILEDDILLKENALSYFLTQLCRFESDSKVFQISGFSPLSEANDFIFKYPRISTWGWAGWKSKLPPREIVVTDWSQDIVYKEDVVLRYMPDITGMFKLQYEGKINAWSLDYQLYMIENDLVSIYPSNSHVINIGNDGSGVNSGGFSLVNRLPKYKLTPLISDELVTTNDKLVVQFKNYYSGTIFSKIKKLFKQ